MSGTASGPDEPARPDGRRAGVDRRPRRRPWPVLALVAVLAVAVGVAVVLGGLGGFGFGGRAAPPEPETVVLPSPTPTVAPIARPALTPFTDALPLSVLDHALTSIVEERPLLVAGALEGYRLVYSDGAAGVVTVLAGQWATPEEAAAAAAGLTAGAAPLGDGEPTSGEVGAGGAATGTWTLTAGPDGLAAMTWHNGTAVLQVLAPPGTVRDLYAAFPL